MHAIPLQLCILECNITDHYGEGSSKQEDHLKYVWLLVHFEEEKSPPDFSDLNLAM